MRGFKQSEERWGALQLLQERLTTVSLLQMKNIFNLKTHFNQSIHPSIIFFFFLEQRTVTTKGGQETGENQLNPAEIHLMMSIMNGHCDIM